MTKQPERSAGTGMPGRPEQHRLEDRSRLAFGVRAPDNWAVSDRTKDYGIDLDVEIFEADEATGLRFAVQMKSVRDAKGRPRVSVPAKKLRYWLAQDVPVVLCLWDAESDRAWLRWAHHIDPEVLNDGAKSVGVKFSDDEIWADHSANEIENEVRAVRAMRDARASLPLQVNCTGVGTVGGVSAGLVVRQVRRLLQRFPAIFRTAPRPSVLSVGIEISAESTIVRLAGGSPKVLEYGKEMTSAPPRQESERIDLLAADILFVVAAQLDQARLHAEAAEVLETVANTAPALLDSGLSHAVAILSAGGKRSAAVAVLDRARKNGLAKGVAGIIALMLDRPLDASEADLVVDVLREWAATDVAQGDLASAAVLTYNMGRRSLGSDPAFAAKMLNEAAAIDPSYRDRDYWCRDLGGALFLSEQYAESVDAYARAVSLGDASATLLLADALLFAGQYARALELLQESLNDDKPKGAEYRLKARYLRSLMEATSIDEQMRDDFVAERICDVPELTEELAIEALGHDLLCPMALWRIGAARAERDERSVEYALGAVFSEPSNAGAWVGVLGVVAAEAPDWWMDALSCAHRFAGDGVLDRAWEVDPESAALLQEQFRQLPEEEPVVMEARFTQFGSSEYSSMWLGR